MSYRTVVIESPYAGDIETNMQYLRACMRDALLKGEAPFASHALYTQEGVLRDDVPGERQHGIEAGFAWRDKAEATIVYTDLDISGGMEKGIAHAKQLGHPVEYRQLGETWTKHMRENKVLDIVKGAAAGLALGGITFGLIGMGIGLLAGALYGWRVGFE